MIITPIPDVEPNDQKNSLPNFLKIDFPPSELFVEGLLNRHEFAVLIGRRRHGKTTFLLNLALALSTGKPHLIGYGIPAKQRVVGLFLEDDAAELQEKLKGMIGDGDVPQEFYIYTKDDFYSEGVGIDVEDLTFKPFIETICQKVKPDVIIFANLAHLIDADYNNPKKIDEVVRFVYLLQTTYNVAVVMAAHPRKRGGKAEDKAKVSLEYDSEGFFEECMGSSHFINSAGTLWGIERVRQEEKTVFVGGTQRPDGSQGTTPLEMNNGWFVVVDDYQQRLNAAVNTTKRQAAWKELPDNRPFSRAETEKIVKPHLSHSSFVEWWDALLRVKILIETSSGMYQKNSPLGIGACLTDKTG